MKKVKIHKFLTESSSMAVISCGLNLQRNLNAQLEAYDVNLNQALILLSIFFEPKQVIRSLELQSVIPSTKGNISHCTSTLEKKKFITRKLISADLRGFEFHLTGQGQKVCIELIKIFDKMENTTDKHFSPKKQKMLIHFLSYLN